MKKAVIIGMTAVMLMTGCKSELIENSPENAIEFNAFLNNITRSRGLENVERFAVYGITRDDKGKEKILFDNRQITWDGETWNYSPEEFWKKGSSYWFTALLPSEGNWKLEDIDNDIATSRGHLHFNNEEAGGQEDLILAMRKRNAVKEPSIEPTVDFNFTHQLSRIYFRFENAYPGNAAYFLEISDIILRDAVSDAVMDLTSETVSWKAGSARNDFPLMLEETAKLRPGTGQIVKTRPVFIIPSDHRMTVEFSVTMYLNNGKDRMATYRHIVELPEIEMKKGFSYDLKAVIDEYNTNPDEGNAPLKFIVNEIEQWAESPDAGNGSI